MRTSPLKEIVPEYAGKVRADLVLGADLRTANDKNELEIAIHGLKREAPFRVFLRRPHQPGSRMGYQPGPQHPPPPAPGRLIPHWKA